MGEPFSHSTSHAIRRTASRPTSGASCARRKQDLIEAVRDLLVMRQLATDYPNVWMTEVVHAFYKTPDVAATAWVELRYCRQFLTDLTKQLRRRADAMAIPWIGKEPSHSIQVEIAKLRKTRQQDSADDWLKALSEDHDLVDRLCIELDTLPAIPTFIRDLIADQSPSFGARDCKIRDLLAHPDQLRGCVPEYGAEQDSAGFRRERRPLPFSFVHEGELLQIGKRREARGEKTGDHCDKPDQPETFRWHAALRALNMNLCGLAFSGGGIAAPRSTSACSRPSRRAGCFDVSTTSPPSRAEATSGAGWPVGSGARPTICTRRRHPTSRWPPSPVISRRLGVRIRLTRASGRSASSANTATTSRRARDS